MIQCNPYSSAAHVWDVLCAFYDHLEETVSSAAHVVLSFSLAHAFAVHFFLYKFGIEFSIAAQP